MIAFVSALLSWFHAAIIFNTACIVNHEAINTNGPLQKFIRIVRLSGDIPNNQDVHGIVWANLNQNVRNPYHKNGTDHAVPSVHRYSQLLIAQILGKNIYAWFASQAVGYGIYARLNQTYVYHTAINTTAIKNIARNLLCENENVLRVFSINSSIVEATTFNWCFFLLIKYVSKIISAIMITPKNKWSCNNNTLMKQNTINQSVNLRKISWIVSQICHLTKLNTAFPKVIIAAKNQYNNTNNTATLKIKIRNHCQNNESLIIIVHNTYNAAHPKNISIILRSEIFLAIRRYKTGAKAERTPHINIHQFIEFPTISIHFPCHQLHDEKGPHP